MPGKMSNAFADAIETSVGIQEGNVEIVDCISRIHQFPPNKKSEQQSAPFCGVGVQYQKLDKDMDPTDDDPEWVYYSLGKDSIDKFHPGKADDADDNDPSDEGDDVETEGNTIYVVDQDKPNKKCKWMLFVSALESKGFKAAVLAKGFLTDLIGTKGHVSTKPMDKIEGSEKTPTVLVFDSIEVYPYGGKKGKDKEKTDKSDKGKSKKDEPPKKSGKSAKDDESDDVDDKAKELLATLAGKLSEQSLPVKKVLTFLHTEMIKTKVPSALQKEIKEKFADETWLEEIGKDELELITEIDDGTVTFV